VSSVQWEEYIGTFPAVKLKGLPYNSTINDIFGFLGKRRVITPVDMITEFSNGKPTGCMAVLFKGEDDMKIALKMHRKRIGDRYILVYPLRRSEYHQIVHQQVEAMKSKLRSRPKFLEAAASLKVTGLSFETNYDDIAHIFESESALCL
jgi:RNA recognition motif-containing protein